MSRQHTDALWTRLTAAGLTRGKMPALAQSGTPWTVRVMLAIAGLIAAASLLGFLGTFFTIVFESRTASITTGGLLLLGAFMLFRTQGQSDFWAMFALAVSLSGQFLLLSGLFRGGAWTAGLFGLTAALQLALAVVMPSYIHRTLSAYAAAIAFQYACFAAGAPFLVTGLVAAIVAALWLHEARFGMRHAVAEPVAYGVTVAFMQIAAASLFGHARTTFFIVQTDIGAWPWADPLLTAAVLIVSTAVLLTRAGWTPSARPMQLAMLAVVLVCIASFKAPGIMACLLIVLLGFSNGNRVLTGLGIAALVLYLSGYYYLLEVTLLTKSGVLLATGVVLLAARWLMLSRVMPAERSDA
jgi:Domain of unknown function (DUF4401)